MVILIRILMSRKGMSQLKMWARDHGLYLYPIVKDSKRAFKPLRTLEREANNENFAHSITESKKNSDNAKTSRLAVH